MPAINGTEKGRTSRVPLLGRRRSGLLLHPTSLPGSCDSGVLGADAYRFVDFLHSSGFTVWQMLPLGPVDDTLSPYLMKSAYAGNPRLIDLAPDYPVCWKSPDFRPETFQAWTERRFALEEARNRFHLNASAPELKDLDTFVRGAERWLGPFALYESLKEQLDGRPWWEWPAALRRRDSTAIRKAAAKTTDRIRQIEFEQYLFHRQWSRLRRYARERGVLFFGDVPIYMSADSAEVWWRPELFCLEPNGSASHVAGVPPDYFSDDGQLWGNPTYDWDAMRRDDFCWWTDRLRHQLEAFDLLRIDHFRALESYWELPADAATARNGRWMPGPGDAFFESVSKQLPITAFVAEDLGLITPEVRKLRDRWGLPGMLVLQFAFDGSPDNPFLPENHVEHAVVYTGTHDNDTTMGWYGALGTDTRRRIDAILGIPPNRMPDALIRAAYASPAALAVIPMQDLLGQGSEGRMNTPGTSRGNWTWRFRWDDIDRGVSDRYHHLAESFGRI